MAGKDTTEEEQLIVVGPGADAPKEGTTDSESVDEETDEETRLGHSESDDEDDDESSDEDKPSRKAYHEMNTEEKRQWRLDKKNRQRRARTRDQTELNFLRQRNEALERRQSQLEARTTQTEVLGIDQRISQLKSQVSVADQVIAKAVENGAGDEMVEAQSIRDQLRSDISKLEQMKIGRTSSTESAPQNSQQEKSAPRQVPARLKEFASTFQERHPWFKRGSNEDSDIVSVIDNRVMADGFDPTTSAYWDELEDRIRKRLPHRFKGQKSTESTEEDDQKPVPKKRGGPAFSTSGRGHRPLKKGEVFVSQERREAMEAAGVWDDPVLRSKYLKSYAKYDQENGSNRA